MTSSSSLFVSFSVGAVAVTALSVGTVSRVSKVSALSADTFDSQASGRLPSRHRRALLNDTVLNLAARNDTVLNGTAGNGTVLNGIDTVLNGTARNDTVLNMSDTVLNGTAGNGTVLNGNDTVLNRTAGNATVLNGSDTVLNGTAGNGTVLSVTVGNATLLNGTVPNDRQNITSNTSHVTSSTKRPAHKPAFLDASRLNQDHRAADGSKFRSKIRQNLGHPPPDDEPNDNIAATPGTLGPSTPRTNSTGVTDTTGNDTLTGDINDTVSVRNDTVSAHNDTLTGDINDTVSARNDSSVSPAWRTWQQIMNEMQSLMTSGQSVMTGGQSVMTSGQSVMTSSDHAHLLSTTTPAAVTTDVDTSSVSASTATPLRGLLPPTSSLSRSVTLTSPSQTVAVAVSHVHKSGPLTDSVGVTSRGGLAAPTSSLSRSVTVSQTSLADSRSTQPHHRPFSDPTDIRHDDVRVTETTRVRLGPDDVTSSHRPVTSPVTVTSASVPAPSISAVISSQYHVTLLTVSAVSLTVSVVFACVSTSSHVLSSCCLSISSTRRRSIKSSTSTTSTPASSPPRAVLVVMVLFQFFEAAVEWTFTGLVVEFSRSVLWWSGAWSVGLLVVYWVGFTAGRVITSQLMIARVRPWLVLISTQLLTSLTALLMLTASSLQHSPDMDALFWMGSGVLGLCSSVVLPTSLQLSPAGASSSVSVAVLLGSGLGEAVVPCLSATLSELYSRTWIMTAVFLSSLGSLGLSVLMKYVLTRRPTHSTATPPGSTQFHVVESSSVEELDCVMADEQAQLLSDDVAMETSIDVTVASSSSSSSSSLQSFIRNMNSSGKHD